jgi:glycosyltransferase involved in cell wall biosynthesis
VSAAIPGAAPVCSVIVPSYRSAATIRGCLQAIQDQDFARSFEVIVVDSGDDGTAGIVRREFPGVQLMALAGQTDAPVARNLGAERARAEVLAFIDSDCKAAPDWLGRLYETLEGGYDAVGGSVANGNGETLVSWAGYVCEFREFLPRGVARDAEDLTEGNVAYRKRAFLAAGGFPSGCFPQEGQILHRRLRDQGARLRFDPAIVVAHTHRSERRAFLEHQRRIGRTNARVLVRLGRPGAALARHRALALMALPALVPYRFLRTVRACFGVAHGLVLRRPALAALVFRGMCSWGRGFVEGAGTP